MKITCKFLFSLLVVGLIFGAINCGGGQVAKDNRPAYKIGDTGPGGGIVFFAEDGQYKECGVELGSFNWHDASKVAQRYNGGDLTDWRLPDKDELDLIYKNLHVNSLGEFSNGWYWSSSSGDDNDAWNQNFNNGNQRSISKFDSNRVRAVRVI